MMFALKDMILKEILYIILLTLETLFIFWTSLIRYGQANAPLSFDIGKIDAQVSWLSILWPIDYGPKVHFQLFCTQQG